MGYTTSMKNILATHNYGGSVHTAKNKPWELIGYFAFKEKIKAINFEIYLKSHAGRAFANKRLW